MKLRNSLIYLFLSAIIFSACTSGIEKITDGKENVKLTFTADNFKYANQQTRTSFDITEEGAKFTWSENDTVGIFPDQGSQVFFSMAAGSGTNTALFDGGGWALKSSSTYAAYYPFKGDIYLNKTAIPVSYVGQKQVGNNSTDHLGAYDYMAAVASTPENGNVNFNFKHLGSLVRLNIPLENACSLTSIVLHTEDESFVSEGHLDLTSSIGIKALKKSNVFNVSLEEVSFSETNQIATVYFMIAPVDLSKKKVEAFVYSEGNSSPLKFVFSGCNFVSGLAYSVTATNVFLPEAIDLGLPSGIKWANCNLGATKPENSGKYYAWGDINGHLYGGPEISGTSGDIAHVELGGNWRMPKEKEFSEMIHNCNYIWTTFNGVPGGLFTSKINGNSIFFPATINGKDSDIWTSTLPAYGSNIAYSINIGSSVSWSSCIRYTQLSVRPICD